MHITYQKAINRVDWEYVLDNSSDANIFHSTEYQDSSQKDGNKLMPLVCYVDSKPIGLIIGSLITDGYNEDIIEVGSKSGGYPLIIDSFTTTETFINDFIEKFISEYINKKCIFYPPFLLLKCNLDQVNNFHNRYDWICLLDLTKSENKLLSKMTQGCRNAIRFAERNGVYVEICNNEEYLQLLYKYYKSLREYQGLGYMQYKPILHRFNEFHKHRLGDIWVSFTSDNKPVAFAFIWKYKTKINFVYGSSNPDYLNLKPNNILQWEIIKYYRSIGFKEYNMWGIKSTLNDSNESLEILKNFKVDGYGKFKLSFGGDAIRINRYEYKIQN